MSWNTVASDDDITKTVAALTANGMQAVVVENGAAAKAKVEELLPKNAQVMTMTSETLRTTGIDEYINNSGAYESVKQKLSALQRETDGRLMQQLGAAPEWAIGSVHAVTQDGSVLIASNTGSQLPAYVYGADHVIWVVGAQKIVPTVTDGMKRLEEYVLPLESERAKKAYGVPGSNISKLLLVHKEIHPNRVTVIIVKEVLGF